MKYTYTLLTWLFLACVPFILFSQEGNFEPKSFTIQPAQGEVKIDGTLDEATWLAVPKLSGFFMQQPTDGVKASEVTEVQIAFSKTKIFVAAKIYDDNNYVINSLKRDQFGEDDSFGVVFDPMNQKSNGFAFGVNPRGAQSEALMSPNNGDDSWDNRWESATTTFEDHWIVEMSIPFKTLRFKASNDVWGINFFRLEPGSNEAFVWSPIPRQFDYN